jgi:glycosyltransferase involved in cell wall biosynthesis
MHIGLVIYGDLNIVSGGYLYDRQLVNYWRANGHQVTIFALPWRNYWRHLTDNFSYSWYQKLLAASVDVLIQDELNHPSLVGLNLFLRHRAQFPLVSLVHLLRSTEPHARWANSMYWQIEHYYLRQMDGFIHNSFDTFQKVRSLCQCEKPDVIAYPGRDHWSLTITDTDIKKRAAGNGCLRILYVGNFIARKGLHVLLSALVDLEPASWHLTAIGRRDLEPGYVRQIEKTIENSGLKDQVTLIGPRPFAEMPAFFRSHQLFVMPSLYEPFGIVYLEAMGAGLPIIASTAGASRELIEPGQNGFLVTPGATEEIFEFVHKFNQDRTLLAEMGISARAFYEQHPTWAETGAKITAFLEGLTG